MNLFLILYTFLILSGGFFFLKNLVTSYVGRLVIYAPVINSSQYVISSLELTNGIVVIAREQTEGIGRSNNQVSYFYFLVPILPIVMNSLAQQWITKSTLISFDKLEKTNFAFFFNFSGLVL